MKHLNDDQLNQYLDKNFSIEEMKRISSHLEMCTVCNSKYKLIEKADFELSNIKEHSVSAMFTLKVMNRIRKIAEPKIKGVGFFRIIFSIMLSTFFLFFVFILTSFSNDAAESDIFRNIKDIISQSLSSLNDTALKIFPFNDSVVILSIFTYVAAVALIYFINETKILKHQK